MRNVPAAVLVLLALSGLYFQSGSGRNNSDAETRSTAAQPQAKELFGQNRKSPKSGSPNKHGTAIGSPLEPYSDEQKQCADYSVWCELKDRMVTWNPSDLQAPDLPPDEPQKLGNWFRERNGRFIIATVPDPQHTHLALDFDRFVEALQSAAQEATFTFDRAKLPWEMDEEPGTEVRPEVHKWVVDQLRLSPPEEPGLLLFRRHDDPDSTSRFESYLGILLVGEDPTSGVNAKQFTRALALAEGTRTDDTIGIVGPTFSGSFFSLSRLIDSEPRRFVIRSGDTSSDREIAWFRKRHGNNAPISSFVFSGAFIDQRFESFAVDQQHFRCSEIASLSEDETAYGQLANSNSSSTQPPENARCSDPAQSGPKIYFPRGVSTLRSEYQQQFSLTAAEDTEQPPRTSLKTDFSTSGQDDDTVPPFAPKQIALSQEAVLQEIVRTLRDHNIKIVLVRATDVMDAIFLAGQLRSRYPQARLIFYGADLLAVRDQDEPLRGAMTLTTYPLMPGWVTEVPNVPHIHHVFTNETQQGEFNAALDVISQQRVLFKIPPPAPVTTLYPGLIAPNFDQLEKSGARPWLWLTVVGRNGYSPISAFPPSSCAANESCSPPAEPGQPTSSELMKNKISHFNVLFILFLALFSGAFIYLTWFADLFSEWSSLALITREWRAWLCTFVGVALMMSWISLVPDLMVIIPSSILAISVALNHAARMSYPRPRNFFWGQLFLFNTEARRGLRTALIPLITFAVMALGALWFMAPRDQVTRWMYYFRWNDLTSGVCPGAPFLMLSFAVLWWVWYTLKSEALFDFRRPLLPRNDEDTLPGHDRYNNVGSSRTLLLSPGFLIISVAILACATITNRFQLLARSLEGRRYDVTYEIVFLFALLLFANSLYAAWVYWRRCRSLLSSLDRSPLRYTFRLIKGFSWDRLRSLAGANLTYQYRPLLRAIQSYERLQSAMTEKEKNYCAPVWRRIELDLDDLQVEQNARTFELTGNTERMTENGLPWNRVADRFAMNQRCYDRIDSIQYQVSVLCSLIYRSVLKQQWIKEDKRWITREPEDSHKNEGSNEDSETCALRNTLTWALNVPKSDDPKIPWAEEFVALNYISFIVRVLIHIRWCVISAAGVFVLLLLSSTLYPFEPQPAIHAFFTGLFLVMTTIVAIIFGEIHKDATLSNLTDTKPGELGGDFWARMVSFAAIPLFSLVTTQIPQLNRTLFFWVKPILNALGKG